MKGKRGFMVMDKDFISSATADYSILKITSKGLLKEQSCKSSCFTAWATPHMGVRALNALET